MDAHDSRLADGIVDDLRRSVRGRVLGIGDDGYDDARALFNGMIDRRPAAIVQVETVDDVRRTVEAARRRSLPLAVRGGGHNVAGSALCDGGVVVDFSRRHGVSVDPVARVAVAEGGATWADLDRATQAHGLATTGGLVSSTGVAGFTLGGGIGWLVRRHGLAADNLIGATVVTADGEVVATDSERRPDLLWGLRGGGGNFGAVTRFVYRVHPVGEVLGGLVAWPIDRARDVLRFFREFTATAPDELTALAAMVTMPDAGPIVGVAACWSGELTVGEKALQPLREFGPPAADHFARMPYSALQTMLDDSAPAGMQNYWKAGFLDGIDDDTIATLAAFGAQRPSPLVQVHLHQLGGALTRVPHGGSAYANRDAAFVYNIVGMWPHPGDTPDNTAWVRRFAEAMRPHSKGAYVNFMAGDEEERLSSAYGDNLARLGALKLEYDPDNLFRLNQNIRPLRKAA